MLQIDLWKRIVIWGLCALGLWLAMPNAFYTKVEQHNDCPFAGRSASGAGLRGTDVVAMA